MTYTVSGGALNSTQTKTKTKLPSSSHVVPSIGSICTVLLVMSPPASRLSVRLSVRYSEALSICAVCWRAEGVHGHGDEAYEADRGRCRGGTLYYHRAGPFALYCLLRPRRRGIKRYGDPSVCVSVCLSHGAAAVRAQRPSVIGTLAACSLAMCGLRTRPRTDVDPPPVELPSAGAYRLAAAGTITCCSREAVSI